MELLFIQCFCCAEVAISEDISQIGFGFGRGRELSSVGDLSWFMWLEFGQDCWPKNFYLVVSGWNTDILAIWCGVRNAGWNECALDGYSCVNVFFFPLLFLPLFGGSLWYGGGVVKMLVYFLVAPSGNSQLLSYVVSGLIVGLLLCGYMSDVIDV